jgi:hypothetical protein
MVKWGQIVDPMVPTPPVTVIKGAESSHFRNHQVTPDLAVWFAGDWPFKTEQASQKLGSPMDVWEIIRPRLKPRPILPALRGG